MSQYRKRHPGAGRGALAALVLLSGCGGPVDAGGGSGGGAAAPAPLVFSGTPTLPAPEEVFTIGVDGAGLRQLTHDGFNTFLPHFSPDGAKVLFIRFTKGSYGSPDAVTDIVVLDRATGAETQLTHIGVAIPAVWSPDGRQIAYGVLASNALWIMNADGSNARRIAGPSGAAEDLSWSDYAWSSDNWIYFVVGQNVGGCFKARIDRIRPDGSGRVQVSDGGPNCSPPGLEPSGDADPAISPDGKTIYSSRGLPRHVPGASPSQTVRHLYRFSSDAYVPGKGEVDLSAPADADCVAGVPKVSPAGDRIALFKFCVPDPAHVGVYLTDPNGRTYTFITPGFGADWNPVP